MPELDAISRDIIRVVLNTIPSYSRIPSSDLLPSIHKTIDRAIAAVVTHSGPEPDEIQEAEIIRVRIEQGIPVQDVLLAYRTMVRMVREWILFRAGEFGFDDAWINGAMHGLWELNDAALTRFGFESLEMAREAGRMDERRRADTLRKLLFEQSSSTDIRRAQAHWNIAPDRRFYPFKARPTALRDVTNLRRRLEEYGLRRNESFLVASMDGDMVGISTVRPHSLEVPAVVGVGFPSTIETMPSSFQVASRCFNMALLLQLEGVYSLEDLGISIAISAEQDVGKMLVDRYLSPLEEMGEFGWALRSTVACFLDSGLSVSITADSLTIHQNTVRHRVARFQEVTGADLSDLSSIIEVWWALKFADLSFQPHETVTREDRIEASGRDTS